MPGRAVAGVGFTRPLAKTVLDAPERFALSRVREDGEACQQTLRTVIAAGLEALGWPEERRRLEYVQYQVKCLKAGHVNEFEGR